MDKRYYLNETASAMAEGPRYAAAVIDELIMAMHREGHIDMHADFFPYYWMFTSQYEGDTELIEKHRKLGRKFREKWLKLPE